jgi:hypothetical protein
MKRISLFALTILVATCSATAPSIPELRMTPTEVTSEDQGESQIGSSKLVIAKCLQISATKTARLTIRGSSGSGADSRWRRYSRVPRP